MKKLLKIEFNVKTFCVFFVLVVVLIFFLYYINFRITAYAPRLYAFNISFSPDGKIVAVSPSIYFWKFKDGELIDYLSNTRDMVRHWAPVNFSPDMKYYILSLGSKGHYNISLFQTSDGKLVKSIPGIIGFFSDDSKSIIAMRRCDDDFIELFEWNIDKNKTDRIIGRITEEEVIKKGHKFNLKQIKDKDNNPLVIFACNLDEAEKDHLGTLQIWDVNRSKCIFNYKTPKKIYNISTVKDVIYVFFYGSILKVDVTKEDLFAETFQENNMKLSYGYSAFSKDGKMAGVVDYGKVIVYNFESQEEIMRASIGDFYARSIEFSPDGKYLAVGSIFVFRKRSFVLGGVFDNGSVLIYEIETGKMIRQLKLPWNYTYK